MLLLEDLGHTFLLHCNWKLHCWMLCHLPVHEKSEMEPKVFTAFVCYCFVLSVIIMSPYCRASLILWPNLQSTTLKHLGKPMDNSVQIEKSLTHCGKG